MKPIRILIVEDNATISHLLADIFKREGWEVSTAMDGPGGVEAARREKPDVVLLDVMIPRMDGFEVCRTLHNDTQTAQIKIIMLTALNRKIDIEAAKAAGATDYIIKPFDTRKLLKKIHQIIDPQ